MAMTKVGGLKAVQIERVFMSVESEWALEEESQSLDSRMIFTPDYSTMYVSVPKTGATTVKTVFGAAVGIVKPNSRGYRVSLGDIHNKWGRRKGKWSDVSDEVKYRLLTAPSTFRFTSVREPFERLVSCYLDKIVQQADTYYLAKRLKEQGDASFLAFLKDVQLQPPMSRDVHCQAMVDLCFVNKIKYDEIIRYETFHRDLGRVMARLNIATMDIPPPEPFSFTGARIRMHPLLGSRECNLIREIYKADFEAFGYSMALPRDGPPVWATGATLDGNPKRRYQTTGNDAVPGRKGESLSVAPRQVRVPPRQPEADGFFGQRLERMHRQLREILDVNFSSNPFRPLATRFAVAHSPRVGSHLLCEGLLAHGAVVQEFFEIPRIKAVCSNRGFATLETYCDWLLERFAVRGVFGVSGGVKIIAPLELAGELPEFLSDWRFIHLKRLNFVKQGVSELVAMLTGAYKSIKEPARALGDSDYDGSRIKTLIEASMEINAAWEELFELFSAEPLRLTYEELAAQPRAVIARAAEFLDLRGPAITEKRFLTPPLQRQATTLNADWEARFRAENKQFCAANDPRLG